MKEELAEQDHNIHEFFKKLLFERDERIAQLEKQLASSEDAKKNLSAAATVASGAQEAYWEKKFEALYAEQETAKKEYNAQINSYQSQINGLKTRLDQGKPDLGTVKTTTKRGFPVWSLLLGLMAGSLLGAYIHKTFFKPEPKHAIVFKQFQDDHQFNIEYNIAQGRFDKIDSVIVQELADKKNVEIKPELEFIKKVIGGVERKFSQAKIPISVDGFSQVPSTELDIKMKAKKKITITEPTLTVRAEASTTSEKLGKLAKNDVVSIVDRKPGLDKLSMTIESNKVEVKDYWYKVEMPDGMEGWIFGYFTTASQNNIVIIGDPIPSDTTKNAVVKPKIVVPAKDTLKIKTQ